MVRVRRRTSSFSCRHGAVWLWRQASEGSFGEPVGEVGGLRPNGHQEAAVGDGDMSLPRPECAMQRAASSAARLKAGGGRKGRGPCGEAAQIENECTVARQPEGSW